MRKRTAGTPSAMMLSSHSNDDNALSTTNSDVCISLLTSMSTGNDNGHDINISPSNDQSNSCNENTSAIVNSSNIDAITANGDDFNVSPIIPNNYGNNHENDFHNRNKATSKATIVVSIINLLNTVAGTGMLGLPKAYAGAGFISGSIILIFASFFSIMGLRLLAISAKTVHGACNARGNDTVATATSAASFYSVATAAVPQFAIFIDAAVAIKGFGVATSYFITVGDCMSDSFKYILQHYSKNDNNKNNIIVTTVWESMLTSRHFWIASALVFVLPISFFKTLRALKFASTFSLGLIYMLAIVILLYAQGVFEPCQDQNQQQNQEQDDNPCRGGTQLITTFDSTIKNIAIFVFSFACHQNTFTIVNELKNATRKRVDTVFVSAILLALILYLVVAIEGYRTYGSEVKGDILLNYPQTGLVTMVSLYTCSYQSTVFIYSYVLFAWKLDLVLFILISFLWFLPFMLYTL